MVGPLELVGDRHVSAGQIDQPARNEERRDAARPFLVQGDRGVVDPAEAADAGADQDAGLDLLLISARAPIGVAERLGRGAHGVDDEIVDAPLLLGVHPVVGTEGVRRVAARHLGGDLARQVRNVETRDPGRSRFAGDEPAPGRLDAASQGADDAKSGDDDPPHALHPVRHFLALFRPPLFSPGLKPQCDKGRTERRPQALENETLTPEGGGASELRRVRLLVGRGLLEELDRVADGHDRLGLIVRNLDAKLFLEGHDQFDRVEKSAPRSSMKLALSTTLSASTPRCSTTIFFTRSATSLIVLTSLMRRAFAPALFLFPDRPPRWDADRSTRRSACLRGRGSSFSAVTVTPTLENPPRSARRPATTGVDSISFP